MTAVTAVTRAAFISRPDYDSYSTQSSEQRCSDAGVVGTTRARGRLWPSIAPLSIILQYHQRLFVRTIHTYGRDCFPSLTQNCSLLRTHIYFFNPLSNAVNSKDANFMSTLYSVHPLLKTPSLSTHRHRRSPAPPAPPARSLALPQSRHLALLRHGAQSLSRCCTAALRGALPGSERPSSCRSMQWPVSVSICK